MVKSYIFRFSRIPNTSPKKKRISYKSLSVRVFPVWYKLRHINAGEIPRLICNHMTLIPVLRTTLPVTPLAVTLSMTKKHTTENPRAYKQSSTNNLRNAQFQRYFPIGNETTSSLPLLSKKWCQINQSANLTLIPVQTYSDRNEIRISVFSHSIFLNVFFCMVSSPVICLAEAHTPYFNTII